MVAIKLWHWGISVALTAAFVKVHLSDGKMSPDLPQIWRNASNILEPQALIPQAVLFRHYSQVEGLTGGSFLFLMGLYRLLYIANWVVSAHAGKQYKHDILLSVAAVAQVSICAWGIFWPDGAQVRDVRTSAMHLNYHLVRVRRKKAKWNKRYVQNTASLEQHLLDIDRRTVKNNQRKEQSALGQYCVSLANTVSFGAATPVVVPVACALSLARQIKEREHQKKMNHSIQACNDILYAESLHVLRIVVAQQRVNDARQRFRYAADYLVKNTAGGQQILSALCAGLQIAYPLLRMFLPESHGHGDAALQFGIHHPETSLHVAQGIVSAVDFVDVDNLANIFLDLSESIMPVTGLLKKLQRLLTVHIESSQATADAAEHRRIVLNKHEDIKKALEAILVT